MTSEKITLDNQSEREWNDGRNDTRECAQEIAKGIRTEQRTRRASRATGQPQNERILGDISLGVEQPKDDEQGQPRKAPKEATEERSFGDTTHQ